MMGVVKKVFGVSQTLVYIWIESGVLTHYRMGSPGRRGAIRVDEADLTTFLESLKVQAKKMGQPAKPATRRPIKLNHLSMPS
jgi:hypothetical protein